MSETTSPNRWIPFQCPACHGLFRLRKSEVGLTGRCPTCRAVVSAADPEAAPHQLVETGESPEMLLKNLALARTMSPEEVEKQKEAMAGRRRQYVGDAGDQIDWEDQIEGQEAKTVSWKVVTSVVMSALVLGALGIYAVKRATPPPQADTGLMGDESKARALLQEIVAAGRRKGEEEEGDEVAQAIDDYLKFDIQAVEDVVKGFLRAKNVEEMKQWIRDPERVGPLLDLYYGKVDFETEGFESLNKLEVSYRGNLVNTTVQTADFLSTPIAVERMVSGNEETYRVDWESWVGYCDFTAMEMRSRKPTQPFLMRVILEPASYYNYEFKDDKKWRSYGIETRESEFSFLGYVARDSELDKKIQLLLKNAARTSCLIEAAYHPDARAKDQLEIVDFISEGWILNQNVPKQDE